MGSVLGMPARYRRTFFIVQAIHRENELVEIRTRRLIVLASGCGGAEPCSDGLKGVDGVDPCVEPAKGDWNHTEMTNLNLWHHGLTRISETRKVEPPNQSRVKK
jgi:hypothetical protein